MSLHPRLKAALERDGVSLAKLAEIVGLDARTVSKWGIDDEYGSRAAAFRRLEDVIAGRARVVESGREWALQQLPSGVSPAEIWLAIARIEAAERALSEAVDFAKSVSAGVTERYKDYDQNDGLHASFRLTETESPVMLAVMLNPRIIRTAATEMDVHHRGKPMVNVSIKLPEGFRERIDAAAKKNGMTWAEYLRSLGWIFSEQIEE